MTEPDSAAAKFVVDVWERRRQRVKQHYISLGMSEQDADDKATDDVRREIRRSKRLSEQKP